LLVAEPKRPESWSGSSSLRMLSSGLREVLRNRAILIVMVVELVMAFRSGAGDFLPVYFTGDMGMTALDAGLLFTVFLAAGLPAPYFWGYLSDRLERRLIVMLTMGSAAMLWYLLPHVRSVAQLLPVLALLGFVCQGVGGVIQAFAAEVTTAENRDIVFGIYFTLAFTIGSLSPVLMGYFADTAGFQASFVYVGTVSLSAVVASYFMK